VPFFNGAVDREVLVDRDDEARRSVWSVVHGAYTHHDASAHVIAETDRCSRLVWTADRLPNYLSTYTARVMEMRLDVMKNTLELDEFSHADAAET
jgi:hypothetical protein